MDTKETTVVIHVKRDSTDQAVRTSVSVILALIVTRSMAPVNAVKAGLASTVTRNVDQDSLERTVNINVSVGMSQNVIHLQGNVLVSLDSQEVIVKTGVQTEPMDLTAQASAPV